MVSIPERSFDRPPAERSLTAMTDHPAGAEQTAEDETYLEQMSDPAVRERLRAIFEEAQSASSGPGITAEELPGFLREHGR